MMNRALIALGPERVGFGSWDWLGGHLREPLAERFEVRVFQDRVPACDLAILIKEPPSAELLQHVDHGTPVVFCPVDFYGSLSHLESDVAGLSRCSRIVVHARKLARYFSAYAPTVVMDHPLKFVTEPANEFVEDGPLLWVGVRSNLPPVIEFLNRQRWPEEVWLLTNPSQATQYLTPSLFGYRGGMSLRIEEWSAERQLEWMRQAKAAFDVKGVDFRSRHKPPTKAFDYLASGLPLALNANSAPAEQLQGMGFDVATPDEKSRWLSAEYQRECADFGAMLRQEVSAQQVGQHWLSLIEEVLQERESVPPLQLNSDGDSVSQGDIASEDEAGDAESETIEWPRRLAIVSLLFNWPSTGGGTIHTFETAKFLQERGVEVCHFFAIHPEWGLGQVSEPLPYPNRALEFKSEEWTAESIHARFQSAVREFNPDLVIVTDSWNSKVLLAEAVGEFPYLLRLAAQETICPLNNVRLLVGANGIEQCDQNQLASPESCQSCVATHGGHSGGLHQAERGLGGFDQPDYPQRLQRVYAEAAAVLAVNHQIAELVEPYAEIVRVIPSGFDPERFWFVNEEQNDKTSQRPLRFLFAGLTEELIKGFHVLQAACESLWQRRQDFVLQITAEPPADHPTEQPPYLETLGWQSQSELPQRMRDADVVIVPAVAQEALGRTAVEAMGAGRPVIASRIGGLPEVVREEETGLLFEPGDVAGLVRQMTRLFDDAELRRKFGEAGRQRFLDHYTWSAIIRDGYCPLFEELANSQSLVSSG